MARKYTFILLSFVIVGLLLTGCAMSAPPATVMPSSSPTSHPAETPAGNAMPVATVSPDLQPIAEKAQAILTQTLKVDPDAVTILSVQRVQWSDASLGCPQPGMMYAQAITPGYLVQAEVDGQTHEVHLNQQGKGLLCPPEQAKEPVSIEK